MKEDTVLNKNPSNTWQKQSLGMSVKRDSDTSVFYEFCDIFKKTFFTAHRTPLGDCFWKKSF